MKTEFISGNFLTTMARRFLAVMLLALCIPMSAFAHIIERVDVQRAGDETEIVIRFDTQVQYLRHSPFNTGSKLNIYFNVTGVDTDPTGNIEEIVIPGGELLSGATFHYPEPDSSLLVTFPASTTFRIRQGSDARSISIFVPVAAVAGVVPADIESKASGYLADAKGALGRNDAVAAVDLLNTLLNLPHNASSQEAQELIGVARERSGEVAKARAEYDIYLKLYPEGAGAARVRERVAKLGAVPAAEVAAARPARRMEDTGWKISGGFSSYRSHGNSSETTEPLRVILCTTAQLNDPTLVPVDAQCSQTATAESTNPQLKNRTVQNTLISSLDFTTRRRAEFTDSRFVIRDVDTVYFQNPTKPDTNHLNAAYFEQSNRDAGYFARIGRQTGNGGGVLGRFDGGLLGYNFKPNWRLNGVAGDVVEFRSPYKKNFYGASIDMQPLPGSWGGNVFAIEQRVEGKTDRQAVGLEARYFDARKNYYALLDYDTSFKALNIAMLQVNWQAEAGTNYYLTADRRRSPILMLTSAVDTQAGALSVEAASAAGRAVRDDIVHITPMANTFSLGLMHPYTEKWQLGGDFQVSNMSSTQGSQNLPTNVPATQATGNTLSYTARGIGNGVLFKNDMLVLSVNYIDARHTTGAITYSAQSYSISHVARPSDKWQIDTSLRFYSQDSSNGEKMTRVNPVIKGLYHLRSNLSFEAEANYERQVKTGGTSPGRSLGRFFYAGFRWDWL